MKYRRKSMQGPVNHNASPYSSDWVWQSNFSLEKDFCRIVLYKQHRFEGGAALQDFLSFFHSISRRPANRAGSRTQPGIGVVGEL
ncbi:MAG: hypothetical protein FD155_350 [Bacteroidetes bacterium]|nr:MAG: hypothetical protein FD155_350 [Bacteroidota bacterium]